MEKLKTYIKASSENQSYWAARFGISRAHLSQILSGKKAPSVSLIQRIWQETGGDVMPQHWFEAA